MEISLVDFNRALRNFIIDGGNEIESNYYLNLFYNFRHEPDKGLFPMSYHTLSYESDLEYFNELRRFTEE